MNYGNCSFCGAPNDRSPRTGNVYCSDKCWTKNQPQQRQQPRQQKQEPNWDKIREEKEQSMGWLNAKNNASQIITAAINKDLIKIENIRTMFKSLAEYIYGLEAPEGNEDLPNENLHEEIE